MYRSARGKTMCSSATRTGWSGNGSWSPTPTGKVRAKQVRDIKFGSQTEGCVADDRTGTLYVAEEDIGLWSVTADPVRGAVPRSRSTRSSENPKIKDDMEGVGIYDLGGGRGYHHRLEPGQ